MGWHLAVSRIVGSILTVLTIMEKHLNEDMIYLYFQDSCFRMCRECLVLHLDSQSCSLAPKKYTDETCPSSHVMFIWVIYEYLVLLGEASHLYQNKIRTKTREPTSHSPQ